jgi:hypothetical protein
MLRKVIAVIAVAIVGLLIFAATRPNDFTVQRSTRIKATPAEILAFINDFHRWTTWSPYEKYDPALKRTYDGAPSGKGAVYAWDGNSQAGRGRMEILETTPTKTVIKLDFFAPFEAHNTAEFSAVPAGDATEVTWAMNGPSPFVTKLMGVFMNMDKMIGKDFEEGLATLKAKAEK